MKKIEEYLEQLWFDIKLEAWGVVYANIRKEEMNNPNETVEILYSLQEDLAWKYLKHQLKIEEVKNNVQKLYYMKVQEAYIHLMPQEELLHFSAMIDSEINLRYGTREFAVVKDSDAKSS